MSRTYPALSCVFHVATIRRIRTTITKLAKRHFVEYAKNPIEEPLPTFRARHP
jgi:hypothetical protein